MDGKLFLILRYVYLSYMISMSCPMCRSNITFLIEKQKISLLCYNNNIIEYIKTKLQNVKKIKLIVNKEIK
jgi:hypothetical protein